jgi:hypothetical protein
MRAKPLVALGSIALAAMLAGCSTTAPRATAPAPHRTVGLATTTKRSTPKPPPAKHRAAPTKAAHKVAAKTKPEHVAKPSTVPATEDAALLHIKAVVGPGSTGAAVLTLQRRLVALGYWVVAADGTYDDSTEQAVWAVQKVAGLTRDGVVGPKTWAALARGALPTPRTRSGYVIEVDLADDVLMVVDDGHLEHVLNTSTGGGYLYDSGSGYDVADTPTGVFHTYAAIDRMVTDSLGQLWRPRYFTGGFAIHGEGYVPAYPVSHGCVRVSDEAIDWIWSADVDPIGTTVDIYA